MRYELRKGYFDFGHMLRLSQQFLSSLHLALKLHSQA